MITIPKSPGIYAIELLLDRPRNITIGKLGTFNFPAGIYIYSGSAKGPGGLSARLNRHIRLDSKQCHWHIDYLRQFAKIKAVGYTLSTPGDPFVESQECRWCQSVLALPGAEVPVTRFGSSDCRSGCRAHLIYFAHCSSLTNKNNPILSNKAVQEVISVSFF